VNNKTNAITAARQAHSSRCRQRVLTVLKQAADSGAEISISSVARQAGVDRSFLYRHRDLHAAVLAKAAGALQRPGRYRRVRITGCVIHTVTSPVWNV